MMQNTVKKDISTDMTSTKDGIGSFVISVFRRISKNAHFFIVSYTIL
jgi:hypothetical protein